MQSRILLGAAALAVALSGCGSSNNPQRLADQTTRALYDGNVDAATANFDDGIKTQVTRAQVGAISDAMHMLGTYKGLQPAQSGDPQTGRYDYNASFERGTMLVMVRLDPDGKIAAYRVSPNEQPQGS